MNVYSVLTIVGCIVIGLVLVASVWAIITEFQDNEK